MIQKTVQNSIKNSFFAALLKLLQIVFPFVTRTIIIHTLGLAYVGVSGLFTSIFGLLNIAELGIGSALLQALYEPIIQNDRKKENAIINFYRKAYFIIGILITGISLLLIPFLKNIIKEGTYPEDLNIYYIYFINIVSTAIGYLIYSYKSLLLEAHQRGRDANKIRILLLLLQYIVQIPLLLVTGNYYLYISIGPIISLISVISISKICDRQLPGYKPKGDLSEQDKVLLQKNISALFLYKIGSAVNNNVDGIVISAFLGATILGAYNNYYLIVSSISGLISVCYTAVLPSIGNALIGKTKEEMYDIFKTISFFYAWLIGWCTICFSCLLEPFIILWVGDLSSQGIAFSILFAFYFYVWRFPDSLSIIKDSLGLWRKDKWRPFCTACLNLALNILLTKYIGLYGILLSTIFATLCINFPLSMKVVMRYFDKKNKDYLYPQLISALIFLILGTITYIICSAINISNHYINFLIKLIICIFVPNTFYFILNYRKQYLKKMIYYLKWNNN